jgi:hypothetical protein
MSAMFLQAIEWLRIHLTSRMPSVETTNMQDPRFGNTLELAVRFGKTLIIQVRGTSKISYPHAWSLACCLVTLTGMNLRARPSLNRKADGLKFC